jgi:oligopeptide transport system substrate-binding protein
VITTMKIFIRNLFIVTLALGLFSGCSSERKTPVEIGNEQQILHIGNGAEPSDIDPHGNSGHTDSLIKRALFEGLVSLIADSLKVIPGAAESWDISDDGLTYTFSLRKNGRWSNGEPVTAHDFVWTWKRGMNPDLGNPYAYMFFIFKNAKAYHDGELTDFSEVGIRALDDYTFQFELAGPTPYVLQLLAFKTMYPVHRATLEKFDAENQLATAWTRPENFVGNGPFLIKDWVVNQVLSVKKNDFYWDKENIKLNEIHFHAVPSINAEERMFRAGQLHITYTLPPEKIEVYRKENTSALTEFPIYSTYYYAFNTQKPPLDDVRVRKALAYAVDRKLLTERVTKGGEIPAYAFTPPDENGYVPEAKMPEDVALARQLLAEAGYPEGKGFPRITILYNTFENHQTIAVVLQQMWKEKLGIDVNLQNEDWKVWLASIRLGNFDITRSGWGGDYVDPNTFLDVHVTGGGQNKSNWSNARYDELIHLAGQTSDQQERFAYFQEAEAILVDEAPIIPLYTYVRNRLVHPSVKNWHSNILDDYFYRDVYLEADSGEP